MLESHLNPFALLFLLGSALVILGGSRQNAMKALLATALFMPLGQQFFVAGLHLYFFRILILVGIARVLINNETRDFQWTKMDKVFVAWMMTEFIMNNVRGGISEMFVSTVGNAYNQAGTYFLVRLLVRDIDDLLGQIRFLALAAVVLAVLMIPERLTGKNPFYFLGGVPLFSEVRERGIRCQGSFLNSILAGTFGATLFPLMVGLWFQGVGDRLRAQLGMLASFFIVFASASSGPFLASLMAAVGFGLWRMRNNMRLFRRALLIGIVLLALVMKAPVWYVLDRVSALAGGGGWHRSYLIDQFVRHFNEWWLMGTSVTAHWAPAGMVLANDPNNMDITNEYVAHGIAGGLLGLSLFIGLIVTGFQVIGRFLHSGSLGLLNSKMIWALGVCLVAHCASFISVAYFDQIIVFWFWLLAAISCLSLGSTVQVSASEDPPIRNGSESEENATLPLLPCTD